MSFGKEDIDLCTLCKENKNLLIALRWLRRGLDLL